MYSHSKGGIEGHKRDCGGQAKIEDGGLVVFLKKGLVVTYDDRLDINENIGGRFAVTIAAFALTVAALIVGNSCGLLAPSEANDVFVSLAFDFSARAASVEEEDHVLLGSKERIRG